MAPVLTAEEKARIEIGRTLRKRREAKGLTQALLSDQCDGEPSQRTISRAEKGVRVGMETLRSLCAALDLDIERVLEPLARIETSVYWALTRCIIRTLALVVGCALAGIGVAFLYVVTRDWDDGSINVSVLQVVDSLRRLVAVGMTAGIQVAGLWIILSGLPFFKESKDAETVSRYMNDQIGRWYDAVRDRMEERGLEHHLPHTTGIRVRGFHLFDPNVPLRAPRTPWKIFFVTLAVPLGALATYHFITADHVSALYLFGALGLFTPFFFLEKRNRD